MYLSLLYDDDLVEYQTSQEWNLNFQGKTLFSIFFLFKKKTRTKIIQGRFDYIHRPGPCQTVLDMRNVPFAWQWPSFFRATSFFKKIF